MNNNQQLELERIIDKVRHSIGQGGEGIIETPTSIIVNEILSAGYVRLSDVELDEEKILEYLDFEYHNDRIPIKFNYSDLQIIVRAIAQAKEIIKVKGE